MIRLPTEYQEFIHLSRYSRYLSEENRRETWEETVDRYMSFISSQTKKKGYQILPSEASGIKDFILNLKAMPSMRTLMTAGVALERDNMASYNCSYLHIDSLRAFDEAMYVLMCGTGLGFSVERQFVNRLPEVAEEFHPTESVLMVRDSKIGWATAFKELLSMLWSGQIPKWDVSRVRAKGERLKTFGGRASGPEPLVDLFNFSINLLRGAAGRKLTSIECHDLMCKIADIVVVGGVRRSALISLSNLSDERMRHAKSGQWWVAEPQRALANNSVAYTEKPEVGTFMQEWLALYDSKSGERGIFNREAANFLIPERRKELGYTEWGSNPCNEVLLRSAQTCNLSEAVIRKEDTRESIKDKVVMAAILGTIQASVTDFRYVTARWKRNIEEEALLGVSLTGEMDNSLMNGSEGLDVLGKFLEEIKEVAVTTNKEWATKLGINPATAVTLVKPSGTVSQLVDSASGLHARHSPYYIRTVRADNKDPLAMFMKDRGFPCEEDVMKPGTGLVFSFPIKSPEGAITTTDRTAIEQLELWKTYQLHWCEHKPSVTINVMESEWFEVGAWCYNNFDILSGVSFLPYNEHSYQQAPYQEISEEEYNSFLKKMPDDVDWTSLRDYERGDTTAGSQTMACSGGVCEVVDLTGD